MTHQTTTQYHLSPALSKSLLGSSAKPLDILVVGTVCGAVAAGGPNFELQPLLYFLPVAWFLYVLTKVFNFMKNPRSGDFAFILGISYQNRQQLSVNFVNRKSFELFCISSLSPLIFFLVRLILYRTIAWSESLALAAVMFCQVAVFHGILFSGVKIPLFRPSHSNGNALDLGRFVAWAMPKNFSSLYLLIAKIPLPFLSKSQRIIASRQILYLLRYDIVSLLFFNIIALIVSGLIFFFAHDTQGLISGIFCILPITVLTLEATTCMSESADKLLRCSYYSFLEKDVFIVNFFIAFVIALPYPVMYCIKTIFLTHDYSPSSLMRIAACFVGVVSFCQCIALRWQKPVWDAAITGFLGTVILCTILGMSIPLYGIVFPLFASAFAFWLVRR